jgi:hypothetical protein
MNTTQNFNTISLPNLGVLQEKIPTDLYNKLYKECLTARESNKSVISGLTSTGVPDHFFVEKTFSELQIYIGQLAQKYENTFNYLKNIDFLTKDHFLYIDKPWINFQKKHEFLPNHIHDGVLSYSMWIKIPYDEKEEEKYKNLKYAKSKFYSFEFSYTNILGQICSQSYEITKKSEGYLLMFPSKLTHCVYPFYTSDDYRISISGNISFNSNCHT